ncbi:hypothetical protein [Streptomyces sp. DHE17-7]|uniref:hypothetical protein n=1 Tax=Streptomyces sp. DHE17-7 TaxID=2759949 RepID=UPI0022EA96FC|nr:hypothetical protein [Streptomyces sp. DHE17-7]
MPASGGSGGGGGNRTKLVAIVAALAVVVAAGVTGFLVLGGDKDDQADDGKDPKPTATATEGTSQSPTADPSASGSGDNPRGGGEVEATVEGWQVVANPRFGTMFDVPADWELDSTDTSVGFEWDEDAQTTHQPSPPQAIPQSSACTTYGTLTAAREFSTALPPPARGSENRRKDATLRPRKRKGTPSRGVIYALTQPDKKSVKYGKAKAYKTASGLEGSVITAHSEGTPQKGKCDTEGKAITFAFKNGAGDFVTWNLYGAKGVKEEVPEATIQKILSTVRLTEEPPTES